MRVSFISFYSLWIRVFFTMVATTNKRGYHLCDGKMIIHSLWIIIRWTRSLYFDTTILSFLSLDMTFHLYCSDFKSCELCTLDALRISDIEIIDFLFVRNESSGDIDDIIKQTKVTFDLWFFSSSERKLRPLFPQSVE